MHKKRGSATQGSIQNSRLGFAFALKYRVLCHRDVFRTVGGRGWAENPEDMWDEDGVRGGVNDEQTGWLMVMELEWVGGVRRVWRWGGMGQGGDGELKALTVVVNVQQISNDSETKERKRIKSGEKRVKKREN